VVAKVLLMIIIANGAPVLMTRWPFGLPTWPVDGGRVWRDGHRVLGPSKTWRGITAALLAATLAGGPVLGSFALGALVGAGAMAGDLLSSFIKRRRAVPQSAMALGLDQIPESLLPALSLALFVQLSIWDVLLVVFLFVVLELLLSRILYRLSIRQHPH
jgi:CDP-2,3-bis-(O-geranylgeranyl)-sn-glycerol synthase